MKHQKGEEIMKKKKINWANIAYKTLMSFIGVAILSMGGTTFLRGGNVSLDPFTAVNTGISNWTWCLSISRKLGNIHFYFVA